jgi:hypothetical protein
MQEQDTTIAHLWTSLWKQTVIGENFPHTRPLIAHYCSISTMEAVLKNQQLWFSNPPQHKVCNGGPEATWSWYAKAVIGN